MQAMRPGFLAVSAFVLILVHCCDAAEIKPIELLENGGFEEVEDGLPQGWNVNNAGKLSSVADAHTDKLAARFECVEHEWGFCAFARGKLPVSPMATYHLGLWQRARENWRSPCTSTRPPGSAPRSSSSRGSG